MFGNETFDKVDNEAQAEISELSKASQDFKGLQERKTRTGVFYKKNALRDDNLVMNYISCFEESIKLYVKSH